MNLRIRVALIVRNSPIFNNESTGFPGRISRGGIVARMPVTPQGRGSALGSKDFNIRIGQDEISHILDRKENLDHHGQLWEYLSRYQTLGWDLTMFTAQGADLDLKQSQEACWKQLADLGLEGSRLTWPSAAVATPTSWSWRSSKAPAPCP
jgi:hypothetical protein